MRVANPWIPAAVILLIVANTACEKSAGPIEPQPLPDATSPASDDDAAMTTSPEPTNVAVLDTSGLSSVEQPVLRGATRTAIGDVDGDGKVELVVVTNTKMSVHRPDGTLIAEVPVERAIQVLDVTRVGADATIVTGWGRGLQHRTATARVALFRLDGEQLVEEIVLEPETDRAEIVSVIPDGEALLVSWFESNFMVATARAERGAEGWAVGSTEVIRMATSVAYGDVDGDGAPDQVIGRVYGDDTGVDGDAFVLRGDKRVPIPTLRGVRGLALVELDTKATVPQIYLGDGWHQNYGAIARARLSQSIWTGSSFETKLIDQLTGEGEYVIWEIAAASLDGTRDDALVVRSNLGAYIYVLRDDVWHRGDLGAGITTMAVGDLDSVPGDEVILIGATARSVSLRELVQ